MAGKIIKGLSCLGGVGALTVGGVYLKNHIERRNFLWESDERAKKLESIDETVSLFKSNMDEDLVKRNWIREVGKENPRKNGTLEELGESEKKTWEKITRDKNTGAYRRIGIGEEKIKEIEGEYQDYWKRYWEACLAWNLTRDANDGTTISTNDPICFVWYTEEEYREYDEYKEYKKLKEKGLNMTVREFSWTIWKKFEKENTIQNENEPNSDAPDLFRAWSQKSENKSLFTKAGIADLQA